MDRVEPARRAAVQFVTGMFYPLQGGAEVAALREAKALRADGNDVRVLTWRNLLSWPSAVVVEGVPVRRLGGVFLRGRLRTRYGTKYLSEVLALVHLIRTRRSYDVVHLRQLGVMTRPTLLASRITGKPVVVKIAGVGPDVPLPHGKPLLLHSGDLDPASPFLVVQDVPRNGDFDDLLHEDWLGSITLRMLRHRLVTFQATSTRMQAHLLRRGYRPEQIRIIPTGVDVSAFDGAAEQVRARSQARGPLVVLCVAHLRHEKGVDVLLHAWKIVHAQAPDAKLILAGQGPMEPQLRALTAALGLDEVVEFAGMIADVRSVLASADMFVLPSRHEGLSNALLEAMACGLPSVATRVSGSEDVIEDHHSGLLIPPNDPPALAAALLELVLDRDRAATMGTRGRKRIIDAYSQARLTSQLERLYAEVSTRPSAPTERAHAHMVDAANAQAPDVEPETPELENA